MARHNSQQLDELVTSEDTEDSTSHYSSHELSDLDGWDEQDPDLYRMMAAPRPQQGAVDADVEVIDDEYDDDGLLSGDYLSEDETGELGLAEDDGGLSLESDPNGWDDLDDLDALESLNPFDVSRSLLEDAGLLPAESIQELEPVSAEDALDDITPLSDDVVAPLSPMENALAADSQLDAAISAAVAAAAAALMADLRQGDAGVLDQLDSLPPDVELVAMPAYDFQTSDPASIAAGGQLMKRSQPARIARRLWQRDMARLAS